MFEFLLKFIGIFLPRKMSIEHAREGIAAVELANSIINQSISQGGMLGYPWYSDKKIVDYDKLQTELSLLKVRSKDKILIRLVENIENCLNQFFINQIWTPPIMTDSDSAVDPKMQEINFAKATRQQAAYDLCGKSAKEAISRIAELEVRRIF